MSDQQPPAERDTAAVAGPQGTPGTAQEQPQDTDWQKRYSDLQPEYTRATQRLSELEQAVQYYEDALTAEDEDTRRQAIEALGYQLPEEEEPEPAEYEDPYDELRAEVEGLRQWRDQTDQSVREAQEAELIRSITDERLAGLEGLAPEDHDMVLAYAINALAPVREPGVPVPLPDVKGAFEYFQAREIERQRSWAKSKRAPYVSPGGQPASEVPNPGTGHENRMERAMRHIHESQQ